MFNKAIISLLFIKISEFPLAKIGRLVFQWFILIETVRRQEALYNADYLDTNGHPINDGGASMEILLLKANFSSLLHSTKNLLIAV